MPNTIALCAVVLTLIALLSGGRAHIETEHPGWNNACNYAASQMLKSYATFSEECTKVTREHPETLEMRDDYECPDDADESPVVKLAVYGQCICCHEISREEAQEHGLAADPYAYSASTA